MACVHLQQCVVRWPYSLLAMPVHASFGCFPSPSAVTSLSKEDMRRLYFRTTVGENHDGRMLSEEDRAENFQDVHAIGQRTSKYMKYQVKRAPLLDRSATKHAREYIPMPLGDNLINGQLAKSFKEGLAAGKGGSGAPIDQKSSYGDTFAGFSDKQSRAARQKSARPSRALTQTLGGTGDLLETRSSCHDLFAPPPEGMSLTGKVLLPKNNLTCVSTPVEPPRSSYNTEFGRSAKSMLKTASMPSFNEEAMPVLTNADDEVFRVRRACFLSPGQ